MTQNPDATFKVSDMTCGHCEAAVRSALEADLPGAMVVIDLPRARVSVEGDASMAETAIRRAGYTPVRV